MVRYDRHGRILAPPQELLLEDSERYANRLTGYQKQTIIQWQELANSIASTLQLQGTINEDELFFFFSRFDMSIIFPFSAQARKVLPETAWYRGLSASRKRDISRKLNQQPLPESRRFSFQEEDIITKIMNEDFSTVDDEFSEETIALPKKSTFVSFIFDDPAWKAQIAEGRVRIHNRAILRKTIFGPFTFEQYIAMANQFTEDLQTILLNAPPLQKELVLYRGLKNNRLMPLESSSRQIPTFQAFSANVYTAENYKDGNRCCLEKLVLPQGFPAFEIPKKLLRFEGANWDEEVVIPQGTTQVRMQTANDTYIPILS